MLGFMDYIQNAFHDASGWNRDNSYSSITATAQCTMSLKLHNRSQH